jgi:hypothetical protein
MGVTECKRREGLREEKDYQRRDEKTSQTRGHLSSVYCRPRVE